MRWRGGERGRGRHRRSFRKPLKNTPEARTWTTLWDGFGVRFRSRFVDKDMVIDFCGEDGDSRTLGQVLCTRTRIISVA
jgi:hypothetical protein